MRWLLLLLLVFLCRPSAAQVTASDWGAMCFPQGGGAGVRMCQLVTEFTVRDGRGRFRGAVRLLRSETGLADALISGDREITSGSLQIDAGPAVQCDPGYDCKLDQAEAVALQGGVKSGEYLIVRFAPRGMAPVAFSLRLDGARRAVAGVTELERQGW